MPIWIGGSSTAAVRVARSKGAGLLPAGLSPAQVEEFRGRVGADVPVGTLVWFADQPTVRGYNPLLKMFWDPGFWRLPSWDCIVLLLSWLVTTIFAHFVLFAAQKVRQRCELQREFLQREH